ncbi:serine hydrolase domain-containing protein [Streptacidiphilus anmyonensis]|uniref:serine hydrolase domain-containing protein n=1 Tax=Streptacidiphilus anmyonensis TaxID=405782 RepID=UPI0005AA4E54|nr:serine hydrolase domain-containing protein [Streptacidiphilus anmyonensis]
MDLSSAKVRTSTPATRRTVLRALMAGGLSAGLSAWPATAARAADPVGGWASFADQVRAEFKAMGLVGAAVAVVSSDRVLLTLPLGVRDLGTRAPVSPSTRFLVASTTKSMTSLLVATYVDQHRLAWDQRVVDAWPGFRAPTDELTHTLRVRDLLGMATGIDEPPALSGLHEGDPTAPQLLQSLVNLPVKAPPDTTFLYNNTVYSAGGYLPLLHSGLSGDDLTGLTGRFANEMRDRVYGPVGMTGARIADDPRGLVGDFMRGYGPDLTGANKALAYGPVGSYAPAGGTLASLDDMAAYVRMQLRHGVSVNGHRVVSTRNLAECWKPHIPVPVSPDLDPDATSSGYAMGWIHNRYRDGTSLIWHNGGIDGFTSFIGFLPQHDLGLVVLNAMNPTVTGPLFYLYVLNLLLSERFGLNDGVPARIHAQYLAALEGLRALGRRTRPTDPATTAPYLGFYEAGYRLTRDGHHLDLRLGPRTMPLAVLPDGTYAVTGGLMVENKVRLTRDSDGTPRLEVVGFETVRRTVGRS